jgi:hypothetical protein
MEFNTAIAFPILILAIGLILEYWIIQPLRNNSIAHEKDMESQKQKTSAHVNKFINLLIPLKSSYSKIIIGLLFFIFTFVYFFYTYPSYLKNYQESFYQISVRSKNYVNASYHSVSEIYTFMIPKYIQSGQETTINVQVENDTDVTLDDVYIRIGATYVRASKEIPFTADSIPIETTFRNIAPNTKKYTTIAYTPPVNLLDGDEVKLTFYNNEEILEHGFYQNIFTPIKVNRFKAFLLSFFENILLTYWAYFLLLVIVIVATTIGLLEFNPTDKPIASLPGFLYFCRTLIRAGVLLLLILEISAGLLIGYWPDYTLVISIIALTTYIPFIILVDKFKTIIISYKKGTKDIGNKINKRSPTKRTAKPAPKESSIVDK